MFAARRRPRSVLTGEFSSESRIRLASSRDYQALEVS